MNFCETLQIFRTIEKNNKKKENSCCSFKNRFDTYFLRSGNEKSILSEILFDKKNYNSAQRKL